jgi:hypothetical protein
MKVRKPLRPVTTWSFQDSAGDRDLCCNCALRDMQGSCPRLSLKKLQRDRMVAVRCTFFSPNEETG